MGMSHAVKAEYFEAAAKYRDQLNILKGYLPEYELAGRWLGNIQNQNGDPITVDIEYNGDSVVARRTPEDGGFRLFDSDISESEENSGSIGLHFEGTGYPAGSPVPGELYVMGSDYIGFKFKGFCGEETKEPAYAGGGGDLAVVGGPEIRGGAKGGGGAGGGNNEDAGKL